jgi:hypothetical protein
MKRLFLASFVLFAIACSPQGVAPNATPVEAAATPSPVSAKPTVAPTTPALSSPASAGSAVLLFDIGMHIEPLGATPSSLVKGQGGNVAPNPGRGTNYNDAAFFQHHIEDINAVVSTVEKHGGRMTIQAQSPFTTMAIKSNNSILADLEARGHEIGLHFHEDAHLGKNPEALPVETWCAVMKEEIALIKQAGVRKPIRYWSGGNLYPGVLNTAACAGLDVNSDWKNPKIQQTDAQLIGINPWRPTGGPSESNVSLFAKNDPNGKIIFLPEGLYARNDFASMRRSQPAGGNEAYFDFLKQSFQQSLAAAQPDKVNVFHFTVHPSEFRGDPKQPFAVIDRFLTEVVDPAVKAGKVKWATFSEMADAHRAWEKTHPGADPRMVNAPAQPQATNNQPIAQSPNSQCAGDMTFAINVHDTGHVNESADAILRLISLFEKYNVRGDFYFTAPIVELHAKQRPDVIARLRDSNPRTEREAGMTISYHVRPPHPAYPGFDQRLKDVDDKTLAATLRDYETYRLDPATGNLDKNQPGGYTYVAQTFGRKPVVASPQTNDQRIRNAALKVYADLGAQMQVLYHEEGTDPNKPLVQDYGLWVRPSDFSVTRWGGSSSGKGLFWWSMLDTPKAAEYNPTNYLKQQLAAWKGARAPFITALIHENNFYRSGPESWTSIYYGANDKPLSPPFNLNAPDPSRPRSQQNQDAIWKAYEELVAYAAKNLCVVTSEDIVALAKSTK